MEQPARGSQRDNPWVAMLYLTRRDTDRMTDSLASSHSYQLVTVKSPHSTVKNKEGVLLSHTIEDSQNLKGMCGFSLPPACSAGEVLKPMII